MRGCNHGAERFFKGNASGLNFEASIPFAFVKDGKKPILSGEGLCAGVGGAPPAADGGQDP